MGLPFVDLPAPRRPLASSPRLRPLGFPPWAPLPSPSAGGLSPLSSLLPLSWSFAHVASSLSRSRLISRLDLLSPRPLAPMDTLLMFLGAALFWKCLRTCLAALGRYSLRTSRYIPCRRRVAVLNQSSMASHQAQGRQAVPLLRSAGWTPTVSQAHASSAPGGGELPSSTPTHRYRQAVQHSDQPHPHHPTPDSSTHTTQGWNGRWNTNWSAQPAADHWQQGGG